MKTSNLELVVTGCFLSLQLVFSLTWCLRLVDLTTELIFRAVGMLCVFSQKAGTYRSPAMVP